MGVDGNSSGATALMAMVKQMDDFDPGQNIGFLGFGAGTSMTIQVAKLKSD